MDLQETIHKTIKDIQESDCVNCRSGKALMALKELANTLERPSETNPAPPVKTPRRKYKRRTSAAASRTEKPCNKCSQVLPLSEYGKNKSCADGHEGTCKKCKKERIKRSKARKQQAEKGSRFREYPCELCNEKFASPERLASHMRVVHNSVAA